MTADRTMRDAIAAVIVDGYWDKGTAASGWDEGAVASDGINEEDLRVADAVLERLAAGAWQRAIVGLARAGIGQFSISQARTVIAATLGLDPTEVPT